jgi:hypothetical protein
MSETRQLPSPPEYITETEHFILLKKALTPILVQRKCQLGHVHMAFDLLCQTLYTMYGRTDIGVLIDQSKSVAECDKFCTTVSDAMIQVNWSRSTQRTVFTTIKKVLALTTISKNFQQRLKLISDKKRVHPILGKYYGSLQNDHPVRMRLEDWIRLIRVHTKNKSMLCIRNILYFYIGTCVPQLGIDMHNWPENIGHVTRPKLTNDLVYQVCGTHNQSRKLCWFKVFVKHMLDLPEIVLQDFVSFATTATHYMEQHIGDDEDGSDRHRIPKDELEKMYHEAKKDVRIELIFMLLLTTGMRASGLTHIKLQHVASINGSEIIVHKTGRTLEKGNKWFTFVLSPQVQRLLYVYISSVRQAGSFEYLFPGNPPTQPLSTSTLRAIIKKLGQSCHLTGRHLHPHAFRHTYAHILLETGNPVDIVSKLLGHTSSKTTENFYLKESASEVAARANIPWLNMENQVKDDPVPDFLTGKNEKHEVSEQRLKARKKRKEMTRLSILE